MAAIKTHDLVVVVGEYQDRKTGHIKKKYQTVGALIQGDKGPYLMLEKWFNPAGVLSKEGESIFISCFETKGKTQTQKQQSSSNYDDFNDDIPF